MKIVMPKMPDFKGVSLKDKLRFKCDVVSHYGVCPGNQEVSCDICALSDSKNYKKWKAQQKKETLIKWPISSKDNFFVLPRVFVNAMSDKWAKNFLSLLNEYNKLIGHSGSIKQPIKFRVSATKNGKFVKMPEIFRRW